MAPKTGENSMVDLTETDAYNRANYWLKNMQSKPNYESHDKVLAGALKLKSAQVSATDPKLATTVFSLTCIPALCNSTGNLHGGAVALIFDMCTSMTVAPVAAKGFWDKGNVSRTLNCTYLRPAFRGSKCTVESEIVHMGARAGMVRAVIRNEEGKVCYTCEHGKVPVDFGGGRYKL